MQGEIDIDQDFNEEELEMEMIEAEQAEREFEENSQRMISQQEEEIAKGQPMQAEMERKIVKNPISPYMVFVTQWKKNHPEQKFSLSGLGEIWKSMGVPEKEPFQTQYKEKRKIYEQYQAAIQLQNPNGPAKEAGSKYLFPLHRIRAILRQDTHYAPKTEGIVTMEKATQFFADQLLEEVKRMNEGKNRIDYKMLYDCISNARSFSFLECLIEEHNKDAPEIKSKKGKPEVALEMEKRTDQKAMPTSLIQKEVKSNAKKTNEAKVSGQMSLDLFINKQR